MVICSIFTFREYIQVNKDGSIGDASGVISVECFHTWLQRKQAIKSEKEARKFLRTLGSHLGGFDNRVPFSPQEEAAILLVVRVKKVWPCFQGLNVTLGKRGFRSQGYHEKLALGKIPARVPTTAILVTTPRLASKQCQGMEPLSREQTLLPMHFIHLDDVIPDGVIYPDDSAEWDEQSFGSMDDKAFDTCVVS